MSGPPHSLSNVLDAFPVLRELHFFNHAGVAPISGPAADALRRYAELGLEWPERYEEATLAYVEREIGMDLGAR